VSVSSPVGTQIVHAVGSALAARALGKDDIALAYFGDGATSTGAFHVACNFAAVRKAPCIFMCRNNGWAISLPRSRQTASPTFAQKAVAYGMPGVLVDGNDALAVAHVTFEAAARARRGEGPTLIEARTYRRGAHSSSDDPSAYRDPDEPKEWEAHDPVHRLRRYLERKRLWSADDHERFVSEWETRYAETLRDVEAVPARPPLPTMFDDVFRNRPWHLDEQEAELAALRRRAPRKDPASP
jgi:2-oxoisovalerate dehydrogenase E1 component alpha subunit